MVNRITNTDLYLWLLASIFFITGDVLSTQAALTTGTAVEANPIARHIIYSYGFNALLAAKTLSLLVIIALWIVAHHLLILDERDTLDTRVVTVLPYPLDNIYMVLPNDVPLSNTVLVRVIPAIPVILGVYVTVNNILVTTHETTLHEVAMGAVLLFA